MLPSNLASQAWATYMLASVLLYFLPRTLMSIRLVSASMAQGPTVGFQSAAPFHSRSPHGKISNSIHGGWILRILDISTHISIYKICLIALYLIALIFHLSNSYAVSVGAQLLNALNLIFLFDDIALPVFVHSTILAHGLSRTWSQLYLYITVPFLLPAMALSVYCELTTHPTQMGVSIYFSITTNRILCMSHVIFLTIECIVFYMLRKRLCNLGYTILQPDLCSLSYRRPKLNTLFKRISLALSLSGNIYKLMIRRIVNLTISFFAIYKQSSIMQPCNSHSLLIMISITIKLMLLLQEDSFITHSSNKPVSQFSHSLLCIIMEPALFNLFITYSSHFPQAAGSLLFLYDASLYRLQVLGAQSASSIKEYIVTLSSWWFQDTQHFPPAVVQKINEKVLTLLLRSPASTTLSKLQTEAIELLSLPERYACCFLNEVVIPLFYQSPFGINLLTISILLKKISPYDGLYFDRILHKCLLLKRYGKERLSTLYDMVYSNPLMISAIPGVLSCITPIKRLDCMSTQKNILQPRHIDSQLIYFRRKSCFFNKCFFNQLSSIIEHVLHNDEFDSTTIEYFISSIQELEFVDLQKRLFSVNASSSLDYIQHIIHPIIGSRKQNSHESILSKCGTQFHSTCSMHGKDRNLLSYSHASLSTEPTDITKSVDEFLSTTFCPRQSFDDTIKLKETEYFNNRLNLETKSFVGKYLVERVVQLNQPNHTLFKDLNEQEKRNFRNLCIPKHVFFNTEAFIVSINSQIDCSFWPSLQDIGFFDKKSVCFQFGHSRDGTERSPRMVDRAPTAPKKSKGAVISNHVKLFRLMYSALHHFDLISKFNLPPGAISTLCLWITSNETNNYYNSSTVIYIIRSTFLFLYSIEHDSPGFLPMHITLAMLLSALCCMYKHPSLSNYTAISSGHWIADLYADNAPSTSFCTATGWIVIVQSGLLGHCDLITRRRIRSSYLTFSKSFSEYAAVTNYHDVLQALSNKDIVMELDSSKITICKLFVSFLIFSTQAYNKATSLHLSISKNLDLEKKTRLLSCTLFNQQPYQDKDTHSVESMALREAIELTNIAIPILMLLRESLNVISTYYKIKFEHTIKQIGLFIKHTNASANMWGCILK